jgi:hypothetical protein
MGASGPIRAFCYESAIQTTTGAAGSRDDDGVDAPGKSLPEENTQSEKAGSNQNSKAMHGNFRY